MVLARLAQPNNITRLAAALSEVIEKYQPEYIIVWGKRLWNNLPNVGWQDGDDIVVDGYPVATGAYLLSNGKLVKVMAVNHPSVGYSWDYWYKVDTKIFEIIFCVTI